MFMSHGADIVDRDQQMLGELAELDLALARHVQARALATEDPAQVAELSRAYQRISRCVRQTLALKAKLKRDAEQHARWLEARDVQPPAPAPVPDPAPAERARRRAELEDAVGRVIWAEREYDKADWEDRRERRFRHLDELLDQRIQAGPLTRETLDADVRALSADLGLSRVNAGNWRRLPEPDFDDDEDDEPADRRSSA
jgi:hypothetical protein